MKKTLSILMALLLLWSMALPAAAAETAAAATLRLEKAEGTVKVSNASGKSVTVTDGMRLYSGYTIATEKNSYAYVSLDSTKAVKLDASSKAEVRKSGKKLELNAVSGSLFFNVTAPVDKDESLNIRTSTMVTGVRGTSGWVVVIDRFTSRVHLLEGTLTVTSSEPATGQMRQATITSGQTATATLKGLAQAGRQMSLTVTNLQEKQVPGFVAVEVEKDTALQGKIAAKSRLSIPAIIGNAWARLKNEQASANAADQKIQKDLNNIAADEVDQVFQNTAEDDDDDDDDDAPSVPPQPDPTPTPDPTPSVMDLDGPTAAALKAALETPGVTNVTVTNAGANDLSTESYTVSSGQTLDIRSGTFTVGSGQTLDVAGTLTNSGTLDVAGTANITGTAENSGTITITSTNSLHVAGTLTNTGTIQVGTDAQQGLLEISGTLNNTSGSITVAGNSSLTGTGSLNNDRSLTNAGNFSLISTGTFTCKGTYTENRTDQLYAMAKSTDGTVYYLGPAAQMSGWYADTTVTLLGASSGTLPGGAVNASNVTLDLDGHTVDLTDCLTVTAGNTMTIQDTAGGGTLSATNLSDEGLYGLDNSGNLTMKGVSATFQLYNNAGGKLTLTGSSSVAVSNGYAITNDGTGAVTTIEGGSSVSSNDLALYDDAPISVAIYNRNGSTLHVNSGTVSAPNGYAIQNVDGGETCNIGTTGEAVTITGLRGIWSDASGQKVTIGKQGSTGTTVTITGTDEGVHSEHADAYLTIYDGASISSTNSYGIYSTGHLTMDGGTAAGSKGCGLKVGGGTADISGGTVTSSGGNGIEVADGTLNFIDGTVTSECAGILMSAGTLNMQNGTITSPSGGAGIDMSGGTATISGGEVSSAGSMAIHMSAGTLELGADATVSGYSSGIYANGTADITMLGGTVEGAAGIYLKENSKLDMQDGAVTGITYGISVDPNAKATAIISGGTVTLTMDNPTNEYAVSGPFTFSGGTLRAKAPGCFFEKEYFAFLKDPIFDGEYYAIDNSMVSKLQ